MTSENKKSTGSPDILPEDHLFFTFIKKVVRHRCRQSGYRRISPSLLEKTELIQSALGASMHISEGLHTMNRNNSELCLRPELTTGIIRSYNEYKYKKLPQPVELYAIEPVFQKNNSDNNKLQQFTQFDVEIIGEKDAAMDSQIIYLAFKILKDLGIINRLTLQINNLGDKESKNTFNEELKNFYYGKEHVLGQNGQKILEKNPMRLLTSNDEDLKILSQIAPKMKNCLNEESKKYFETVLEFLEELNIPYEINESFIGDADYYTNTIFQFIDSKTNKTILKGGRYNNLVKSLGGSDTPALGFRTNFEDIMELMKDENISIKSKDTVEVFVAQLGTEAKKRCMSLVMKLREAGIHAIGALGKGSMKDQLALAEKFQTSWTIIMGQIEVIEGIAIIRNMKAGSQEIIQYDDILEEIINRIGDDSLDKYSVGVEETVYKDNEELVGEEYSEMIAED